METELSLEKYSKMNPSINMDILQIEKTPILPDCHKVLTVNDLSDVCFYRLEQISYTEDYPHREAFANVLMALDTDAFNFVYILTGNERGVTLDIGVARNEEDNKPILGKKLNAKDHGETLENIFNGNFGGSSLKRLKGEELSSALFQENNNYKNAGFIIGVPSADDTEGRDKDYGFQGIDRLINSMAGRNWRLVIVCKRAAKDEIDTLRDCVCNFYDELAPYGRQTLQVQRGEGRSENNTSSRSITEGHNYSKSKTDGDTSGRTSGSSSSSKNSSRSHSTTEQTGESKSQTDGSSISHVKNENVSQTVSLEHIKKDVQEKMNYIDKELLARLRSGQARGLYKTAVYYMGGTAAEADRLRVGLLSLFQGRNSTYSPLKSEAIDLNGPVWDALCSYQCSTAQVLDNTPNLAEWLALASCPYDEKRRYMGLCTYLTADEVSLMAGLPQREVPGLPVRESVEFGLNYKEPKTDALVLGNLVQKGRVLEELLVKVRRETLNKHVFVAGVTGSGKTTTCHKLLKEANLPFLVIEPAKTEYRALLSPETGLHNIQIFTIGNENVAPLRLNPFELVRGESLTAHIDMLKATFVSAFPMEASMPQILEEAIYKCYEDKGWDVLADGSYYDDDTGLESREFPVLDEFLAALEAVVDTKGFDQRLRDDYRGSLVSRFSNLTKGSKGALLNCHKSTNFETLLEKNVVLEMENLKSAEDKALVMGFILTRLCALIQKKHKENRDFRHLTLIEEAHRLLARPDYTDSGAKRSSVETFTDMLAEIRKYGEGLIIVDQIPNKLAPEVLKNTNTKIIHRLFARDDKEAVGDMMLMDKKQQEYLSALETGQAIVFSEDMGRPLNVKIKAATDTSGIDIEDEEIRGLYEKRFPKDCADRRREQKIYSLTRQKLPSLMPLLRKINSWNIDDNPGPPQEIADAWNKWREHLQDVFDKNRELSPDEFWARLIYELAKSLKPPYPEKDFVERVGEMTQALRANELKDLKTNKRIKSSVMHLIK